MMDELPEHPPEATPGGDNASTDDWLEEILAGYVDRLNAGEQVRAGRSGPSRRNGLTSRTCARIPTSSRFATIRSTRGFSRKARSTRQAPRKGPRSESTIV